MIHNLFDPELAAKMVEILTRNGVPYKDQGGFIYVCCPFHRSKHPGRKNFWIRKDGKRARCWTSCTEPTDWEGYAKAAKLKKASLGLANSSVAFLTQALHAMDADYSDEDFSLPSGMSPWEGSWRQLRADFLSQIGAFRWFDDVSSYYRILFPITMGGVLVGYQAGRDPNGTYYRKDPKYRASDGLPSTHGFFGLDQIYPNEATLLVIVEGLYDCLRFWQNRIPAIANIGSGSVWTTEKAALLSGLPRLKTVLTAFDIDDAGVRAADSVKASLKDTHRVIRVKLPKKDTDSYHDPGSAPQSWHRQLRQELVDELGWSGRWRLRPLVEHYGPYSFPGLSR